MHADVIHVVIELAVALEAPLVNASYFHHVHVAHVLGSCNFCHKLLVALRTRISIFSFLFISLTISIDMFLQNKAELEMLRTFWTSIARLLIDNQKIRFKFRVRLVSFFMFSSNVRAFEVLKAD